MKVLLVTPPMTQINTPYPATAYLTGFLKEQGFEVVQKDLGLELFLKLFSKSGLSQIKKELEEKNPEKCSPSVRAFLRNYDLYFNTIESVVDFLQGNNPTLSYGIIRRGFLPEGPGFKVLKDWAMNGDEDLHWAFGIVTGKQIGRAHV